MHVLEYFLILHIRFIMSKRIIAYILFALGFVLYVFCARFRGEISFRIILVIIGMIMHIVGYRMIKSGLTFKQVKAAKRLKKIISDLKEDGEKILVDLSTCEIIGNDYYVEVNRDSTGQVALLDAMYDKGIMSVNKEIDETQFIFTHQRNGFSEKFVSPVIPRTRDDLRIKLYLVKTTTLYVDKADRSKYYFDLDFYKRD